MHLNNIETNSKINITKIDIYENRINYEILSVNNKVLDFGIYKPDPELITLLDPINDFCLNKLIQEVFKEDCIKSNDSQNWIYKTRTVRLLVSQKTIITSLSQNNNLWPIIKRLRDENIASSEKFIFEDKNIAVVYVNDIDPNDAEIVIPYITSGEITKQDKNI